MCTLVIIAARRRVSDRVSDSSPFQPLPCCPDARALPCHLMCDSDGAHNNNYNCEEHKRDCSPGLPTLDVCVGRENQWCFVLTAAWFT
jgi:hypothetical protein